MSTVELLNALSSLNLQSLSNNDFNKMKAILNLKSAEADWIFKGRTHFKSHFPSEKK